jgi:Cupin-like domain
MPESLREIGGIDPRAVPDEVLHSTQPVLLRGLVADWPAVRAAQGASPTSASDYLRRFYRDATVDAWLGAPAINGRFFYNDDLSGFNFSAERLRLDAVLDELALHQQDERPPALYVGSTSVETCLPGFRADNNDLGLGNRQPLVSVWIGNRTCIAAHHDLPDNIACVIAGRRRFTLFPPDAVADLYVGPLDFTPAGQAISLVDVRKPDLAKHPRYAQAAQRASVAVLQPGDAVFIPSLWWHHVEALDAFNVLVNYWWRDTPAYMDSPMTALMLAILTLRELPAAQRHAWRSLFDHYIFNADDSTAAHIPPHARHALAPLDAQAARALRAQLLKKLNR